MKKANEVQKKKLELKSRTITKFNGDHLLSLQAKGLQELKKMPTLVMCVSEPACYKTI